jgi:acetyltransferase-like isoleucine patch superfamily enzyme
MIRLLHRLGRALASRARNLGYRLLGVDLRDYCWMRRIEIPRQWSDVTLHGCALDTGVVLLCSGASRPGKIEIGYGTYLNRYTMLDAHEQITIGRDVMIGPHTYITDGAHGTAAHASVKSQPMTSQPVTIEDEAWIGAHVTILAGVRIGQGAIIGAGSVVTTDIPRHAVAYGVPATVRRLR